MLLTLFDVCPVCGETFNDPQTAVLLPTNYFCHPQCIPDQFQENYILFEQTEEPPMKQSNEQTNAQ